MIIIIFVIIIKMYFVFHIKKTEIQILLILILNNCYLVENFLLGANEKQYLIDYVDL